MRALSARCALALLVAAVVASGRSSSIYCGDERYCDDDQTCCKSGDAGTHFFCCQAQGATCCGDMQSCCPPEFPVCDLHAGGCVGKHTHRREVAADPSTVDQANSDPNHGKHTKH
ncbi:hypothetical protein T492DRAFT_1093100 [Pavlovales sp. CCMP2436]|nr:hypothetical protein T492DRAFT_1093100 [Pavlovales sp. CCMP2436]|mmetsp:Transcript_21676/g.54995  ORF Transcript_21676/g.54995 Transcript_21676/m.54995 type:complete len:115 (-) Transcript_21676:344-688(-)